MTSDINGQFKTYVLNVTFKWHLYSLYFFLNRREEYNIIIHFYVH